MFGRRSHKIHESAHLKNGTAGTSNEVSFSVLDAASRDAEERDGAAPKRPLGSIRLFSMPVLRGGKRRVGTPTKDKGLTLSTGEFVSGSEDGSIVGDMLANAPDARFGEVNRDANIESSDMLSAMPGDAAAGRKGGAKKLPSVGSGTGKAKTKAKGKGKGKGKAASAGKAAPSGKHALGTQSAKPGHGGAGGSGTGSSIRFGSSGKRASFEDEVGRRKRRRRRMKIVGIVAGVLAVIALAGAGAIAANRIMTTHIAQSGTVDGAVQEIGSVDAVIVEMDELLTSGLDTDSLSKIEKLLAKVPDAEKRLAAARVIAQDAAEDMQLKSDAQYALDTECAIDARLEMIDAGEAVLKEAEKALAAKKLLDEAWEAVIAADTSIRAAASQLAKSTDDEGIAAARDKMLDARTQLESSLSGVEEAQAAYPTAKLSSATSYVQKRIEAIDHAVAAANALIDEDPETAKTEIAAYTEADTQATQLAKGMSGNPSTLIADAYDDIVEDEVETYRIARDRAASYDAGLRARLES